MLKLTKDIWKEDIYSNSREKGASAGGLQGGGQQPLDMDSVKRLCVCFLNLCLFRKIRKLSVLWLGCGYGEECILMVHFFRANKTAITIDAIELQEDVTKHGGALIKRFDVGDDFCIRYEITASILYNAV
jgi:SAM-dependent methyltransferase